MEKSLQELIEERISLAVKKKIKLKVEEISKGLGIGEEWDNPADSSYSDYIFKNADFLMRYYNYADERDFKYESNIIFHGQVVYEHTKEGIQRYIPGSWEEEFEQLYLKAIEKSQEPSKKKEEEEKQLQEAILRNKFGL